MKILNELNMTRDEMATALGVSRRTVDSWYAEGASRRNMPLSIRMLVIKLIDGMYLNRNMTGFLQSSKFTVEHDEENNCNEIAQAKFQMNLEKSLDIKFDGMELNLGTNFAYLNYEDGYLGKSWLQLRFDSYEVHDAFFKDGQTLVLLTEAGWIEFDKYPSEFKAWHDKKAR